MTSYWWALLVLVASVCGVVALSWNERHHSGWHGMVIIVSLVITFASCVMISAGNDSDHRRIEAIKDISIIERDWLLIPVEEKSFSGQKNYDPRKNSYIAEKVEEGVILCGKITSDHGLVVYDVHVVPKGDSVIEALKKNR